MAQKNKNNYMLYNAQKIDQILFPSKEPIKDIKQEIIKSFNINSKITTLTKAQTREYKGILDAHLDHYEENHKKIKENEHPPPLPQYTKNYSIWRTSRLDQTNAGTCSQRNLLPKRPPDPIDKQLLKNSEIVWIQPNALSHCYYYNITKIAKNNNISLNFFSSSSAKRCAEQMAIREQQLTDRKEEITDDPT